MSAMPQTLSAIERTAVEEVLMAEEAASYDSERARTHAMLAIAHSLVALTMLMERVAGHLDVYTEDL